MFELVAHPDTPPTGIARVAAQILPNGGRPDECWLEFHVACPNGMKLPSMRDPERADHLWQTTCFELFLKAPDAPAYVEYNLSPSFQWAAYHFDAYRKGMRNLEVAFDPEIDITADTPGFFWLACELDVSGFEGKATAINLAAVIEEPDGTKSYWALAHAPGPPDFHNPDCFIATLPAPTAP